MVTVKKQPEKAVSTDNKKNYNDTETTPKIKLRAKRSNAVKSKISQEKRKVKIARHKNWNSVTVDDPDIQHLLLKPASKKIRDANELITEFNEYLASCIEKTRIAQLIPVKTENVIAVNENSENLEEMLENDIDNDLDIKKTKSKKGGQTTVTNNVIAKYEILDGQIRGTIPTI